MTAKQSQPMVDEVHRLIEADELPQDVNNTLIFAAIRLVLKNQEDANTARSLLAASTLEQVQGIHHELKQMSARIEDLERTQRLYPSMRYMFAELRREGVLWSVILFGVGLAFWLPLVISDLRIPLLEGLAKLLGL